MAFAQNNGMAQGQGFYGDNSQFNGGAPNPSQGFNNQTAPSGQPFNGGQMAQHNSAQPAQQRSARPAPAQHAMPGTNNRGEKKAREEYGRQYGIFSGSASIKFYAGDDKEGNPTIYIQAANKVNGSFNWNEKTTVQFMQRELPELLMALYGLIPNEVSFDNHGDRNSPKSVKIKHQQDKGNIYVSVIEKGKNAKGAAMSYTDAMMIASMVLAQLKKTMEISEEQVLQMSKYFVLKMKYGMKV